MGTQRFWRVLSLAMAGAVAALALASCGKPGGGTDASVVNGKPNGPQMAERLATAKRAQAGNPRDFSFMRYSIDVSKDLPRACLIFNTSLDPKKDYKPFVAVNPNAPIVLSVEGANLCVGGLTFGAPRELTLRSGLPAADGRTLNFDETVNVEFGDRPAYVGFNGDGVILPRIDADGLGFQTVNVDKVKVTISRITDRALAFKTISNGYAASPGNYGYMEYGSDPAEIAEKLWTGTMETPGSPNVATTTVFPIAKAVPKLQAGAYFVEVEQLNASGKVPNEAAHAKRWLIITDLALTTYSGLDGMSTTVRSLQTAKPMRGVKLELVAHNNEILARGESDASGHVRFTGASMHGVDSLAPKMLTAYAGNGDFTVLDLDRTPVDLTERDIGGREPAAAADAFVYTERGVYRPGETVMGTGLIRDAAANALTNRPGALVVYGPNGLEAGRQRFEKTPAAGVARFDFVLPKTAARGGWRMAAVVDGVGQVGDVSFTVEDFVPQRIKLDLKTDTDTPLAKGQTRDIDANVRFLYGAPGAGPRSRARCVSSPMRTRSRR